jgi:hypothetical protein
VSVELQLQSAADAQMAKRNCFMMGAKFERISTRSAAQNSASSIPTNTPGVINIGHGERMGNW